MVKIFLIVTLINTKVYIFSSDKYDLKDCKKLAVSIEINDKNVEDASCYTVVK